MQSICKHFISAVMLLSMVGLAQANCWEEAGREFSIAPELLYAIAEQESNLDPRAIGRNRDGSRDIGLMQVNSYHLPRLAKFGITEKALLEDSCRALKVGAGILADFMRRYGYSWEAVGAYNAGTAIDGGAPERRQQYAQKIAVRYQRILKERDNAATVRKIAPAASVAAIPAVRLSTPTAQLPMQKNTQPKRL
jgi:soluble lytic murein transglycosylase-like protein